MASIRTRWSSSRAPRASRRASPERALLLAGVLGAAGSAGAALDLRNTDVERLDNGLMVLVLEEPAFPLVSVQMLYRAGARDETAGRTGLAHFVEHMAFRGSEHFPDTGLVSSIYAAGGEWHGYTYLDQTTYFATAPADELDLLLRIEADRMARLEIAERDVPAEIGAVLAEMRGYENDPFAVLHDATLSVSFVAHPYRNNTIGWESDVKSIARDDVVDFYERHYQPGNAVLAIVGDVDAARVFERVRSLFGGFEGGPPSALPVTREPPQAGVRRLRLEGPVDRKYFQVAWRSPAVVDPDYPALLLTQELLSGSAGVNFLQNDWGTPARDGAPLAAVADDVSTWTMPTAQPYVLVVKGSIAPDGDEHEVEEAIGAAVATLATEALDREALDAARARLADELTLDLQTTEDAAHELAFWSGIDALEVRRGLRSRLAAVRPADVRRVAAHYLAPAKRTIGWSVPGEPPAPPPAAAPANIDAGTPAPPGTQPAPPPEVVRLARGLPVILQPSPLSPTVHLGVVLPGRQADPAGALVADHPVTGVSSYRRTVPADELGEAIDAAARAAADAAPLPAPVADSSDPYQRTEELFAAAMHPGGREAANAPVAIVVAGDFDRERTLERLAAAFGDRQPAAAAWRDPGIPPPDDLTGHIDAARAQARIGYLVAAPPPGDPAADAWRTLAYILSHDYEGRLGKAAISRRGLVYYIDTRYRSDGRNAWITLSSGVSPSKLPAMRALLEAELRRLRDEPPTAGEVAEALAHRRGRAASAHQSNAELAGRLLEEWLWYGELLSADALDARLRRVERAAVLDAIDEFIGGSIVTVTVESPRRGGRGNALWERRQVSAIGAGSSRRLTAPATASGPPRG